MSNKIFYNGVEYDREDLPYDIRRFLERHENTDWKEVDRRQRKNKWESSPVTAKSGSVIFLADVVLTIFLAFYSFFSNVSTTVDIFGIFGYIYVGLLSSLVGSGSYLLVNNKESSFSFGEGLVSRFFGMTLGVIGIALFVGAAIFSGLPSVLHHITSQDGSVRLTVARKSDSYSRYHCSPGLFMREFTWSLTKPICPGGEIYEAIEVGDVVNVSGRVSSFGVQAKYLSLAK